MLEIHVDKELRYSVSFYIEGTRVAKLESSDLVPVLREIHQRLLLEMGLAKGKVFSAGYEKGSESCNSKS
jgi:hypothetical protein